MARSAIMDGHDAPISLSPIATIRQEEGLQHNADADPQQAPSPFPESDDPHRQSIPWETHPRRLSTIHDPHHGSIAQNIDSRCGSENGAVQISSGTLRRQTTITMSGISEDTPPDWIPSTVGRQELESQVNQNSTAILHPREIVSEKSPSRLDHTDFRWLILRSKRWRYVLPILVLVLLAILIAIIVLYTHIKKSPSSSPDLDIITTTQALALPAPDSALAATTLSYSNLLSSPSSIPSTLIAYTTSNNSICILTYTNTYLIPVTCITSLPLKPHTPLTILDWYGGPSIYYITHSNHLNGLDSVPQNNTWRPSSLNTQSPQLHPSSQLASVTWLNGSSAWLYYQDATLQLQEYGIDDYRDVDWRTGATGPLGLALEGSGIGTSRYLRNASEVLEVFIQTDNNAIHGRVFADSVWEAEFYSVDGMEVGLSPNAALTAATLTVSGEEPEVLLAWVNSASVVNVQSRGTANVSAFNAFDKPEQLIEGDGGVRPGLTATGLGAPRVWVVDGVRIWDLKGIVEGNWTSSDVTSV